MPVFIDCDADYYSINEALIEAAITPKTKAILPLHLHGQVCQMDTIIIVTKKCNMFIIEDCAQSHFSQLKGVYAGSFGNAGCIVTNDNAFAEKCKMYARHGALVKHQHKIEGINFRMDGLQVAILLAKLPYISK